MWRTAGARLWAVGLAATLASAAASTCVPPLGTARRVVTVARGVATGEAQRAKEGLIGRDADAREKALFATQGTQGIQFDKYADIKVECRGPGADAAPPAARTKRKQRNSAKKGRGKNGKSACLKSSCWGALAACAACAALAGFFSCTVSCRPK